MLIVLARLYESVKQLECYTTQNLNKVHCVVLYIESIIDVNNKAVNEPHSSVKVILYSVVPLEDIEQMELLV